MGQTDFSSAYVEYKTVIKYDVYVGGRFSGRTTSIEEIMVVISDTLSWLGCYIISSESAAVWTQQLTGYFEWTNHAVLYYANGNDVIPIKIVRRFMRICAF